MSYEPTEWKTGDVVTAAKLNKLEDGVANAGGGGSGGGLVVHMVPAPDDPQTMALDKTWAEINAVVENGGCVYLADEDTFGILTSIYPIHSAQKYTVDFLPAGVNMSFASTSPDGYPKYVTT